MIFASCPQNSTRDAFFEAADRWNSLITENRISPTSAGIAGFSVKSRCNFLENDVRLDPGFDFDHLVVVADLVTIDGAGAILAQAGPCLFDRSNGFPILGGMLFDTSDLRTLNKRGNLDTVILHEMGHVFLHSFLYVTLICLLRLWGLVRYGPADHKADKLQAIILDCCKILSSMAVPFSWTTFPISSEKVLLPNIEILPTTIPWILSQLKMVEEMVFLELSGLTRIRILDEVPLILIGKLRPLGMR